MNGTKSDELHHPATAPPPTALRVLALLLTVGCVDDSAVPAGDGRWHGETTLREDGVLVVANPEAGVWTPEQRWNLKEDLRIGSLDEPPYAFDRIREIATDAEGRIYLGLDRGVLKVFDADGSYLRTVGRRGEGPGEMRSASSFDVYPNGTIWLADPVPRRYSFFDSSGAFVGSARRKLGLPPRAVTIGFGGDLYDGGVRRPAGSRTPVVELAPIDSATGDPARPPVRVQGAIPWVWEAIADDRPYIYNPRMIVTWDLRGHIWWARNDRYRLVRLSAEGDTQRIVQRAASPVPIPPDTARVLAEYRERLRRIGAAVPEEIRVPETLPFFHSIVPDDEGNLWLPVYQSSLYARAVDVFDPEGRYLGRVEAGFEFDATTFHVRRGYFYAVTPGSHLEPYLVRALIVRPRG